MAVAIEISARNTRENTGGPFGTAIYEKCRATGTSKLLSVGCNRVVPLGNSTLHGEMTAIQFAQKKLGTYNLQPTDTHEYVLCTSCEPCCMCLGKLFTVRGRLFTLVECILWSWCVCTYPLYMGKGKS